MATVEWKKPTRGWPGSLKLFHTHKEQSSFPRKGPLLHFPGSGCSNTGIWGYPRSWPVKGECSQILLRLVFAPGTPFHPVRRPRSLHTATIANKAPLTFGKQSQLEAVKQDEASQTFSKYLWSVNMLYPFYARKSFLKGEASTIK